MLGTANFLSNVEIFSYPKGFSFISTSFDIYYLLLNNLFILSHKFEQIYTVPTFYVKNLAFQKMHIFVDFLRWVVYNFFDI